MSRARTRFAAVTLAVMFGAATAGAQYATTSKRNGDMVYTEVPTSVCLEGYHPPAGFQFTWKYKELDENRVTGGIDSCFYEEYKTPSCKGNYTWNAAKKTCCKDNGKCDTTKIDCPADHPYYDWRFKFDDGIEGPLVKVDDGFCRGGPEKVLTTWCKDHGYGDTSATGFTPGHRNHDWCYKYSPQ